ncbi:phage tail protein [Marinobacter sp. CA1]|uniref:phage tail protein n=1 Tax=Marinobacter sp. CA1 TaxID=2817656 RepID=UPI001D080D26|nr:phage tail protein [Marinobacter sp. CA1]UDL03975.1 phage tail protein [Marinobacter sp. CA1]
MSIHTNTKDLKRAQGVVRGAIRAVEKAQFRAVNRVTSKTRTLASKKIREEVRLKAAYINQNLKVTKKASINDPEAVITGRKRPTRLARYGAKQLARAAKSKNASGDSVRGIAPGRKQAGVSVSVSRRGGRKKMRKAFLIPLKSAGVMGVFTRNGSGRGDIRHRYGPSVDQVFRGVRKGLKPEIRRNLAAEYSRQFAHAARKEIK